MLIFKKVLKYFLILLLVVVVVWSILLALLFSPRFLTPQVVSLAQTHVKGEFSVKNIDISLFNRFPNITMRIDSLSISQTKDSIDDLIFARECRIAFDPAALLFKRLDIKHMSLRDAKIYVYVDSLHGPLKCFNLPEDEAEDEADTTAMSMDLSDFKLRLRRMVIDSVEMVIDDRTREFYTQIRNFGLNMSMDLSSGVSRMKLATGFENILVWHQGELLAKKTSMSLDGKILVDRDSMKISFHQADIKANEIEFKSSGELRRDTLRDCISVDVTSTLNTPSLAQFLELVPSSMLPNKESISTEGVLALEMKVEGDYSDDSMPTFTADVRVEGAKARYASRKLSIDNVNYDGTIFFDPNIESRSYVQLNNFYINTSGILEVQASGRVTDFMGSPNVDIAVRSNVDFDRFTELFPLNEGLICKGTNVSDIKAQFSVGDMLNGNYAKLYIDGESTFNDMEITFDASKFIQDSSSTAYLYIKAKRGKMLFGDRVVADNDSRTLRSKVNFSGLNYLAKSGEYLTIKDVEIAVGANFDRTTSQVNGMGIRAIAKNTSAGIEDLFNSSLETSDMTFTIAPKNSERQTIVTAKISSETIDAHELTLNTDMSLSSANMDLRMVQTAEKEWDTSGTIAFSDFGVSTEFFPLDVNIYNTEVSLAQRVLSLNNASVKVGQSEFMATGYIKNILYKLFVDPRTALSGELSIAAPLFHVSELLEASNQSYVMLEESGFITDTEEIEEDNEADGHDVKPSADQQEMLSQRPVQQVDSLSLMPMRGDSLAFNTPQRDSLSQDSLSRDTLRRRPPMEYNSMLFFVPRRVSFLFDLNIEKALYEDAVIEDVEGNATLENGVISLDKLTMKLLGADASGSMTYRNLRGGDANVAFNMSLNSVDINRISELGPMLSDMFPMLESFEGIVDFDIKANTNLLSTAEVDYSTLRSAMSFKGHDLVLMDGETFATISKMLLFKNKDRNLIDELELYALVDNTQIDVLPFSMSIDRYTAYIAGTQVIDPLTFDVDYDYDISIIKSPLPFKAGVKVTGDLSDFKFKITSATLKKTDFDEQRKIYQEYLESIK
ncbi:MAG: AsmA-like C-terminal region-containing protein [Rikenellaceae bacterium]